MTDNIAEELLAQQRLEKAVRLRVKGAHWSEISRACGYSSPAAALRAVGEAMEAATQRADETADTMRNTANLQYDALMGEAWAMLEADAPDVYDKEGNPVTPDDRGVRLRAVDEIRRLVEAKTKLNGVGAPEAEESDNTGIRIVFEGRPGA